MAVSRNSTVAGVAAASTLPADAHRRCFLLQDYLVFLTLGRREPYGGGRVSSLQESPLDHADAFNFVDRRISTDSSTEASYARNVRFSLHSRYCWGPPCV